MSETGIAPNKLTHLCFKHCHHLVFRKPLLRGEYVALVIFRITTSCTVQLVHRHSFTPAELNSERPYHLKHLSWKPVGETPIPIESTFRDHLRKQIHRVPNRDSCQHRFPTFF